MERKKNCMLLALITRFRIRINWSYWLIKINFRVVGSCEHTHTQTHTTLAYEMNSFERQKFHLCMLADNYALWFQMNKFYSGVSFFYYWFFERNAVQAVKYVYEHCGGGGRQNQESRRKNLVFIKDTACTRCYLCRIECGWKCGVYRDRQSRTNSVCVWVGKAWKDGTTKGKTNKFLTHTHSQ